MVMAKLRDKPMLMEAALVFILALAIGHSGPYGTYAQYDAIPRMVLWVLLIMSPWSIFKIVAYVARRLIPEPISNATLNLLLYPAFAVIGSAVVTPISMQAGLYADQSFMRIWPPAIITWLAFSFLFIFPITQLGAALARNQRKEGVTSMMHFFNQKLPKEMKGAQLWCLKAEDHYLKVMTDHGSALILMKFEDAVSALNGYPGIQTHRSWWVSASQLQAVSLGLGASNTIPLSDGTEVPVSRRRKKVVKEFIESL